MNTTESFAMNATPERNRIQNLFLRDSFISKLCDRLELDKRSKLSEAISTIQASDAFLTLFENGCYIFAGDTDVSLKYITHFETEYNWNLELQVMNAPSDATEVFRLIKNDGTSETIDVLRTCIRAFNDLHLNGFEDYFTKLHWTQCFCTKDCVCSNTSICKCREHCRCIDVDHHFYLVFSGFLDIVHVEIVPRLGDEYPCLLRKLKMQRKLMGKKKILKKDFPDNITSTQPIFVLLVDVFTAKYTDRMQLREMFDHEDIRVIFLDEVDDET